MDADRKAALDSLRLYTLTELEPVLGVSHQTLVRYVKAGKLKARKIEGKWRVSHKDLEAYVNGETSTDSQ
jgi:excisionase family DNA binding protein